MDVLAVGAGPRVAEYLSALREVVGLKGQAPPATGSPVAQSPVALSDTIAPLLRQLSEPDLSKLLAPATRTPAPEMAVRMEAALQESVAAAKAGDVPRALVKLAEFVALDQRRAEAFAPLRREVDQFLSRLVSAASQSRPAPEPAVRAEAALRESVAAAGAGDAPLALAKLAEFVAADPGRAEAFAPVHREVAQFLSRLALAADADADPRTASPVDAAGTPLDRLTKQDVVKFLELVGRPPLPETVSRIEGLLRASIAAARAGDVPQAMARLTEIAALDPRRAEALDREPGLAPIEREVSRFQSRLASTAHMDAEARLDRAAHLLGSAELKELSRTESGPRMALAVAERLLEARGYASCVYSAQLSQTVIDRYGYVPAPATPELASAAAPAGFARALPVWRDRWTARIRNVWKRAPLLILLLAWFGVGLAGGCVSALLRHWWPEAWPESAVAGGFELWAVGFLALVGFGFYARVRSVR